MWDSDNGVGKNMNAAAGIVTMTPTANHGRLKFTAQGSRFNFTIKGPNLWGAKTTGFMEMDFDAAESRPLAQLPALRSARFQLLHASPAPRHVPVQLAHL